MEAERGGDDGSLGLRNELAQLEQFFMRHLAERLLPVTAGSQVSAHLYRTFPKLGISRECLVAELGAAAGDVADELARDVLRVAVVAEPS